MIVVRPGATPIRNRLVGEAGCTRAIPGSADMTVVAGCGSGSSRPVPASMLIGWPRTGSGTAGGVGGTACPSGCCGCAASGPARGPDRTASASSQAMRSNKGLI